MVLKARQGLAKAKAIDTSKAKVAEQAKAVGVREARVRVQNAERRVVTERLLTSLAELAQQRPLP